MDTLKEGALYVVKKGVLTEIVTDPEDTMRKVKITDDAFQAMRGLQHRFRKEMSGYRPDTIAVCSGLIQHAAQQPDAINVVKMFCLNLFRQINDESDNA